MCAPWKTKGCNEMEIAFQPAHTVEVALLNDDGGLLIKKEQRSE